MIVTGVRHVGVEAIEQAARFAARCGHPLVTGFGVAGDERMGDFEDYVRAFEIAREAGLGITIHAGELMGWESVAGGARSHPARRASAMACAPSRTPIWSSRIADEGVVLECCPGSNIALSVFPSLPTIPFRRFKEAGCKVTLNSDDPPYFWTSLKREYDIAAEHFGMNDKALTAVTRTAIEAAFVDRKTKTALLARLNEASR